MLSTPLGEINDDVVVISPVMSTSSVPPATADIGSQWFDMESTPIKLYVFDGSEWLFCS